MKPTEDSKHPLPIPDSEYDHTIKYATRSDFPSPLDAPYSLGDTTIKINGEISREVVITADLWMIYCMSTNSNDN